LLATPSSPIRGATTTTVANITQRKPHRMVDERAAIRGIEGDMSYDGLETSLTKRYSNGLQFLASYTYSKTIDSDGANVEGNSQAGAGVGDQNDEAARKGPARFSRPHRLIVSFVYELPWMRSSQGISGLLLGGWSITGVATFQSGRPLTLTGTNSNNAFGFTGDRAQLGPGCANEDVVTSGSVTSRLDAFFNTTCAGPSIPWPVIGDDGRATAFGNSGVGIVRGPDQRNVDLAFVKRTRINWPTSGASVDFRPSCSMRSTRRSSGTRIPR
jgi:hypothetical protein